jgi:hypothetical protein
MNRQSLFALLALVFTTLACSPVIAISWHEFLLIGILVLVLLGPPLYRLVRRVEAFWKRRTDK